jgi:hypothetical protein
MWIPHTLPHFSGYAVRLPLVIIEECDGLTALYRVHQTGFSATLIGAIVCLLTCPWNDGLGPFHSEHGKQALTDGQNRHD